MLVLKPTHLIVVYTTNVIKMKKIKNIKHLIALYCECDGEVVYRMDAPYSREIRSTNRIEFLAWLKNCSTPGFFDDDKHGPKLQYIKLLLRPLESITLAELNELKTVIPPTDQVNDELLNEILTNIREHGFDAFQVSEGIDFEQAAILFYWMLEKQFDIFKLIENDHALNITTYGK